jgi:hypothetical protein
VNITNRLSCAEDLANRHHDSKKQPKQEGTLLFFAKVQTSQRSIFPFRSATATIANSGMGGGGGMGMGGGDTTVSSIASRMVSCF